MMQQLSLFDGDAGASSARSPLDATSERLLREYGQTRSNQGASHQSVRREISQLRSVARACGQSGTPRAIEKAFKDVSLVARALREPSVPIAQATGRARLIAVHRFYRIIGPALGRNAAADIAALDALLPARRSTGWHTVGTIVAGERGRRRTRGPTLDAADLVRIVDAAGRDRGSDHQVRDRALVAIQCFSGLRVEEILRLRWNDLDTDLTVTGHYGPTASVERQGRQLRLLLPNPIGETLDSLRRGALAHGMPPEGPVFHACGSPDRPLSYRAARNVLVEACRRAGLPAVSSAELRAACAYWLRSQGLSEHEVMMTLGLTRVRSVDRMLRRHQALDAQRRVREQLEQL